MNRCEHRVNRLLLPFRRDIERAAQNLGFVDKLIQFRLCEHLLDERLLLGDILRARNIDLGECGIENAPATAVPVSSDKFACGLTSALDELESKKMNPHTTCTKPFRLRRLLRVRRYRYQLTPSLPPR